MLSTRTRNRLREAGISSVGDLRAKKPQDLLALPSFGLMSLDEVKRFLKLQDLSQGEPAEAETLSPMTAPLSSNPFFGMLSSRTRSLLHGAGILSLAEMIERDEPSLLDLKGFGAGCLDEVNAFLEANGLLPVRTADVSAAVATRAPRRHRTLREGTRILLEEAGICLEQGLKDVKLFELLAISGVNAEVLDDLVAAGATPRPRDIQDLLLVLSASKTARAALRDLDKPFADGFLSVLTQCREKVEKQLALGVLREEASMDRSTVQAFNERLLPPARTLSDLLLRLQYLPGREAAGIVDELNEALDVSTVEEELSLLLGPLDERDVGVLRARFAAGKRPTLDELGAKYGVSRERIRQVEKQVSEKFRKSYYWGLPLLRMRTAMLLVREDEAFSMDGAFNLLGERGLVTSRTAVADFFAVWRAITPGESAIRSSLIAWRAIDPRAFAFPEEIVTSADTNLTRKQRGVADEVKKIAQRRLRIVGVVDLEEVVREMGGERLSVGDVAAVLANTNLSEVAPGYWGTTEKKYAVHRVAEKMVKVCGPLHAADIHIGLLRHQQRQDKPVPPLDALRAALDQHQAFHKDADDMVHLRDLGEGALPNAAEYVWLETATSHGPVVHVTTIYRAFKDHGLNSGLVAYLIRYSEVVQPVGEALYCMPGTRFNEEDLEAGRAQASNAWAQRFSVPTSGETRGQDASETRENDGGQRRLLLARDFGQALNPPRSKEAIVGLCQRDRIEGATKGPTGEWLIPEGATLKARSRPTDSGRREGVGPDQYAKIHGVTRQRVHQLLGQNEIEGAKWTADGWDIPPDAPYPKNRYGTR